MSHVLYEGMGGSRDPSTGENVRRRSMRMMFFWGIMYVVLLMLARGATKTAVGPSMGAAQNHTEQYSPLQGLLDKDQTLVARLLDTEDIEMMRQINDHSTLELKTLVIAETVVPYDNRDLLSTYVKQQLDASNVISAAQKEAVLTMVNLAPMEACVNKEEIGEKGTLRNSAVMALMKRHSNNVHFMLIGVRAEPRLGWTWLAFSERNAWNDALSRVLANKIRKEAKNYLWKHNTNEVPAELPTTTVQ